MTTYEVFGHDGAPLGAYRNLAEAEEEVLFYTELTGQYAYLMPVHEFHYEEI